jgi:hypothetical protein
VDVFCQEGAERDLLGRREHGSGTRERFAAAETAMRAVGEDGVVVEWKAIGDGLVEGVGSGYGRDGRLGRGRGGRSG